MKKKILLVGGCGFIGHNLALYLKKVGHDPVIVDSLSVNNLYAQNNDAINANLYKSILLERIRLINKNNINLIIQDARDYQASSKIYAKINPDIIIHLAAVSHANKSNKDPHTTFDHSLRTLENTLDYARHEKKHVIYISSSMVYGNFESDSVDETDKCNPIGIYGSLKLSGEIIVKSYNQVFDLPYTIIRPSALYGERCVSRRVGQVFIENLLNEKDIIINGDGNEKLDFTYIDDLTDGIEKCCINKNAINETFNLTFGNSRPINDLIKILKNKFGEFKVSMMPKDKLNPERGTLNTEKAKKLLNYQPQYELDRGYEQYINWYQDFYKIFLKNEQIT
tara:strand:+ start:1208 stop:2221 length:1014 start_codon:yes stop_codon:yes gene_type:complete